MNHSPCSRAYLLSSLAIIGMLLSFFPAFASPAVYDNATPHDPRMMSAGGSSTSPPILLRLGSRGARVSDLQRMLATDSALYPEGLITGYYGKATETAVKRFQAKYGIVSQGNPKTTGYGAIGSRTWAMLNRIYGNSLAPRPSPIPPSKNPFLHPTAPSTSNSSNPFLKALQQTAAPTDCAKKPPESQDSCWQGRAIAEKNPAFCSSIKESNVFVSKDACLSIVASTLHDRSLCAPIQNPDIRANCLTSSR